MNIKTFNLKQFLVFLDQNFRSTTFRKPNLYISTYSNVGDS